MLFSEFQNVSYKFVAKKSKEQVSNTLLLPLTHALKTINWVLHNLTIVYCNIFYCVKSTMSLKAELILLLPPISLLKSLFVEGIHSELSIICCSYKALLSSGSGSSESECPKTSNETAKLLISALTDKLYEHINTGHWSNVADQQRQAFTIGTFLGVLLGLDDDCDPSEPLIARCLYELDFGLLLGCPLPGGHEALLNKAIERITEYKNSRQHDPQAPPTKRHRLDVQQQCGSFGDRCDIPILAKPSVLRFQKDHFQMRRPALLTDCLNHWPAITKWLQPGYLSSLAGDRTVPIEIGAHYTNEEWSQELVRFREFVRRQIERDTACDRIEYLAQHNLFDQVPGLRADIRIPDYCCCSDDDDDDDVIERANEAAGTLPDIKAWLGPKGTVSPMHHDPKHNLLCQVFGHKTVILAAPEDGPNLYPHPGTLLANTSQIDAERLDVERFPLCKNVRFFHLTLYAGEMLYMPPGWWHHIRSQDKSFSVSFWW